MHERRTVQLIAAALARSSRSSVPEWAVQQAARPVAKRGAWDREPPYDAVRECIEEAGEIARAAAAAACVDSPTPMLGSTPLSLVEFEQRLRDVEPWVAQVRERYFSRTDAPFDDYAEAVDWLLSKMSDDRGPGLSDADQSDLGHLYELTQECEERWWNLTGRELAPPTNPYSIEYETPTGQRKSRGVGGLDSLAQLARASALIARYLGTRGQAEAVRLILTGERPQPIRAHLRISPANVLAPSGWLKRSEVVLTLLAPLRRDDIAAVLAGISEAWSRRRYVDGRVTDRDLALHNIVAALGGADRDEQPFGFWRLVRQEWEAAGLETVTSNALLKRWTRLRKKLEKEEADRGDA